MGIEISWRSQAGKRTDDNRDCAGVGFCGCGRCVGARFRFRAAGGEAVSLSREGRAVDAGARESAAPAFCCPNHFSRFPFENPFVDRRISALYDEPHLIWREAMTCPTFRCPR